MWNNCQQGTLCNDEFPFFHLVTTRALGNARDKDTRAGICRELSLNGEDLVITQQVHGTNVVIVDERHKGRVIHDTDGLITGTRGVMLAIFTADCVPVFLADRNGRAVGLVHAGWRGLVSGIIGEAVRAFEKNFGVQPRDIEAMLGPHIRKCCYSVGPEFRDLFPTMPPGETNLDMSAIAAGQLRDLGAGGVLEASHCTGHETGLFYSFRSEKTASRIMSLIRL